MVLYYVGPTYADVVQWRASMWTAFDEVVELGLAMWQLGLTSLLMWAGIAVPYGMGLVMWTCVVVPCGIGRVRWPCLGLPRGTPVGPTCQMFAPWWGPLVDVD
jgi:hypothetical protein